MRRAPLAKGGEAQFPDRQRSSAVRLSDASAEGSKQPKAYSLRRREFNSAVNLVGLNIS